jgi:hypothetical protein
MFWKYISSFEYNIHKYFIEIKEMELFRLYAFSVDSKKVNNSIYFLYVL